MLGLSPILRLASIRGACGHASTQAALGIFSFARMRKIAENETLSPCLQPEDCFVCAVAVEFPPPPPGRSRGLLVLSRERRGVQEENLQVQSKPSSLNFKNDASSQSQ